MQNWFKARAAVRRFADDQGGAVIVLAAAAVFVIMGIGALAVDMGYSYAVRTKLQTTADAAALAAVAQISDQAAATSTALAFAESNMQAVHFGAVIQTSDVDFGTWNAGTRTFDTTGTPADSIRVTAQLSAARGNASPLFFANIFGMSDLDQSVTAIATEASSAPCLLSLDPTVQGALSLDSNASITANGCSVQVNSSDPAALTAGSNSSITADSICVNGDYDHAGTGTYSPPPNTSCAPMADPLGAVAPPPFTGCDFNNTYLDNANVTLFPGVYCGGLHIDGNSNVTLDPGVYVIKDLDFHVDSNSIIQGNGVGFYLTNGATLHFDSNTQITLSAPTAGPMAGLLVFQDRADSGTHSIDSNAVAQLEGAIYLPDGVLTSDSNSNITGTSAYTIVIARQIILDSNATLVLNSDYAASGVPLPSGLGGASASLVH